jgi:UDP-2,3-diacylglucosamine pyrophosphatase LpxH
VREGTRVIYVSGNHDEVFRDYCGISLAGVVAGHIHHAQTKRIGGVLYCNDGDWVESCTALIEDTRGRLEVLDWTRLPADHEFAPREVRAHVPPSYAAG